MKKFYFHLCQDLIIWSIMALAILTTGFWHTYSESAIFIYGVVCCIIGAILNLMPLFPESIKTKFYFAFCGKQPFKYHMGYCLVTSAIEITICFWQDWNIMATGIILVILGLIALKRECKYCNFGEDIYD